MVHHPSAQFWMLGQQSRNGTTDLSGLFKSSSPCFSAVICIPHNSRFGFFVTFTTDLVAASLSTSAIVTLRKHSMWDFITFWTSSLRISTMTFLSVPHHIRSQVSDLECGSFYSTCNSVPVIHETGSILSIFNWYVTITAAWRRSHTLLSAP